MSMTTIQVEDSSKAAVRADFARDLIDLIKPRITSMVLVTVALSQFVASTGHIDFVVLFHTLLGTLLVAASSGAFNQWLERDTDARMDRTSDRPLPTGRMGSAEVIGMGVVTLIAGLGYLALTLGWQPAFWAAATWVVYVCVYTPMKVLSNWNTAVGAISGALPILIGWSAVSSTLTWPMITMFLVMFLWQFPHFIAIAWIYREQYSHAGLQMVTVSDPSGRKPGFYSVLGAVILLMTSLLPVLGGFTVTYALLATALGLYQALAAWRFQQELTDLAARQLLKASIIYLPLLLGLIAVQTVL